MDNKLFNELKKNEIALTPEFTKKESEIIELYFFLLYLKLLPFLNSDKYKEILEKINFKKALNYDFDLWAEIANSNMPLAVLGEIIDSFEDEIDIQRYDIYFQSLPKDTNEETERSLEYEIEQNKQLKAFDKTKEFLEECIRFINNIEHLYDVEYNRQQFFLYLTDFISRDYNHDVLQNINSGLFSFVLDKLNNENVLFATQNNILNIVKYINNRNKQLLFNKKVNLFTKSVLDIFSVNYIISKNDRKIPADSFYDFSFWEDEKLNRELENFFNKKIEEKHPSIFLFNKEKQDYRIIKNFIRKTIRENYLREVIYSNSKEVIFTFYYSDEAQTIRLINYDEIAHKKIGYDGAYSLIKNSHYLSGGIDFSSIFQSEIITKKLKEISQFFEGNIPLSFRFVRKQRIKKIITDSGGEYIITANDLLTDKKLIQTFVLEKSIIPNRYLNNFLESDAIVFSIINNSFVMKVFKKRDKFEKVYLAKNVSAIVLTDEKFGIDNVYLQIKKLLLKLQEFIKIGKSKQEIKNLLAETEIVTFRDKKILEEKVRVENIFQREKKLLEDFLHKTRVPLSSIETYVEEIFYFLEKFNMLEEFEEQKILLTEAIKRIQNKLYEIENQEEINIHNFEVIDLCGELKKIRTNKLWTFQIHIKPRPCSSNIYNIFGPKDSFIEIIEELLNNADKYAFDNDSLNKIITFDLSVSKFNTVELVFTTENGKPFLLTTEEFIREGITKGGKGKGHGGYMINNNVKILKGNFEVISNNPLKFKFSFPKY